MSGNKSGNKNRRSIKSDILSNFKNFSLSSMVSPTHLEINGNNEIIVEGCKSIIEYDENIVKISTKKMYIAFLGRNLNIKCLTIDSLVIEGFITSVEFMT